MLFFSSACAHTEISKLQRAAAKTMSVYIARARFVLPELGRIIATSQFASTKSAPAVYAATTFTVGLVHLFLLLCVHKSSLGMRHVVQASVIKGSS